jgi:phosphatidylglycerol:prolipoprotein diacylglycerol transferase
LIRIGSFEIPSFGVALALGILLAWTYFRKQFSADENHEALASLITYAVLAGLAGSRINYMLEHLDMIQSFRDFAGILFSRSGLTVYGGLIAGTATAYLYARKHQLSVARILDAGAPAICIGYFFGRLGCQLAGDGDYGIPSSLPWAMAYPNGTVPTLERVHPTPLYEMFLYFLIFMILRMASKKLPQGKTFALFLVLAGLERFLIEFLRTNPVILWGATEAQIVSLVIMAAGFAGLSRRTRREDALQRHRARRA